MDNAARRGNNGNPQRKTRPTKMWRICRLIMDCSKTRKRSHHFKQNWKSHGQCCKKRKQRKPHPRIQKKQYPRTKLGYRISQKRKSRTFQKYPKNKCLEDTEETIPLHKSG